MYTTTTTTKSYFVPCSELSEEKKLYKRRLNQKHCETYIKRRKSSAAEPSIVDQKRGDEVDATKTKKTKME